MNNLQNSHVCVSDFARHNDLGGSGGGRENTHVSAQSKGENKDGDRRHELLFHLDLVSSTEQMICMLALL